MMSGIDTINDMLHDPAKRKPWTKRIEMLSIVIAICGSWSAVGYGLGHKDNTREIETIRADYAARVDLLREKQGRKLEELRNMCAAKAVK